MIKIGLTAEDRERFGCPEWLEFTSVTTRDAEAFEDAGGMVGWFDEDNRARVSWWRSQVWLALRRIGISLKYDEVHFSLTGVRVETGETPGKAPSARSGSRTRKSSASSTRASTRRASKS